MEGCNQLLGISQGDDGHGLFLRRVLSTAQMDPNNNQDDPWFLLGVASFGTKVSQIRILLSCFGGPRMTLISV